MLVVKATIFSMLSFRKHWPAFMASGFAILVDQLSKYLVLENKLFYVFNYGIAFSFPLSNFAAFLVGILIVCFLFFYGDRLVVDRGFLVTTTLGLVIGGAMGNLIDRLRFGAVIDFIKLPYWPAFNVADTCIVVGMIILFLSNTRKGGRI